MTTSRAEAIWEGDLKGGNGRFSADSGAFSGAFSFATRFEGEQGTTPEELIAAAFASCLSMALAAGLHGAGKPARRITTNAACVMAKADGGFRITTMKLKVRGIVPGMEQGAFRDAAEEAKRGCPVSQALQGNVEMELDAQLE